MLSSVFSINRVFFLSLGGVCFLIIPFFWLALMFDYKALENFMIKLSESNFVGYPIPELFGASMSDSVVSQVFRMKIFLSLIVLFYSLFFISLYSIEENTKRLRFLFRGISIPLFFLLIAFWLKFVDEDHIVVRSEKNELFIATTVTLVFSILLFAYSFRSQKKKRSTASNKISKSVSVSPAEQNQNELSDQKELTPIPITDTEVLDNKSNDESPNDFPTDSDLPIGENNSDAAGISSNEEAEEGLKDMEDTSQKTAVIETVSDDLSMQSSSLDEKLIEKEQSEEEISPTQNQEDGKTPTSNPDTEISENEQVLPTETPEVNKND